MTPMPKPEGHHRWTHPGERARRPRQDVVQSCQLCGQTRRAVLVAPHPASPVARFRPGQQIWVWQYDVGLTNATFQRPPCRAPRPKAKAPAMSYPRDLDDYKDEELINELARRCAERSKGNCDYCRRPRTETTISGVTRPTIACNSGRHVLDENHLRAYLVKMGVADAHKPARRKR